MTFQVFLCALLVFASGVATKQLIVDNVGGSCSPEICTNVTMATCYCISLNEVSPRIAARDVVTIAAVKNNKIKILK